MKDEGEANGGRGTNAGCQQVEAVKQVEAIDQYDTRDYHERYANPAREVEGHRHGDDRSHSELSRKSQRCRKPEAVIRDPDGQGCGQRDQNDRPADRHPHHKSGEDGGSSQVGDGHCMRLQRSWPIDDAESMGDHDAARYSHCRDDGGGDNDEDRRAHAGGIAGGAGHRIRRDTVPGCNSNLSAIPNPARPYRAIAVSLSAATTTCAVSCRRRPIS